MKHPADVIALYRASPEEFIAGRDELAKDLRDRGRDDEARAVKALRRPTVVAWALNQLTDRDPTGVEALLDAGAELRAAQRAALSGGGPERLRSATSARRRAVSDLTGVAVAALSGSGRDPGAHLEEITSALEAAAVGDAAGEGLRRGTLERPPRPESGFGALGGLSLVPEPPMPLARPKSAKTAPAELRELKRRADVKRTSAELAQATADALSTEIAKAESQVEKLRARHREAIRVTKAADLESRRAERDLRRAED